ncbi:MAG: hypothetical protein ACFCD0_26065 [Gemmataceae bacterium]
MFQLKSTFAKLFGKSQSAQRRPQQSVALRVEQLDSRLLLSSTPTAPDFKDLIESVISSGIVSPRDAASGLPTGVRQDTIVATDQLHEGAVGSSDASSRNSTSSSSSSSTSSSTTFSPTAHSVPLGLDLPRHFFEAWPCKWQVPEGNSCASLIPTDTSINDHIGAYNIIDHISVEPVLHPDGTIEWSYVVPSVTVQEGDGDLGDMLMDFEVTDRALSLRENETVSGTFYFFLVDYTNASRYPVYFSIFPDEMTELVAIDPTQFDLGYLSLAFKSTSGMDAEPEIIELNVGSTESGGAFDPTTGVLYIIGANSIEAPIYPAGWEDLGSTDTFGEQTLWLQSKLAVEKIEVALEKLE